MIELIFALFSTVALAQEQPPMDPADPSGPKSLGDYLIELDGEDPSERLMAARSLRGHLRRALNTEARANVGSIAYDDARSLLFELETRLPEVCMHGLSFRNVVAPCADMLGWLEVQEALPALQTALAAEDRKRVQKRIEAAIAAIQAAPPESP